MISSTRADSGPAYYTLLQMCTFLASDLYPLTSVDPSLRPHRVSLLHRASGRLDLLSAVLPPRPSFLHFYVLFTNTVPTLNSMIYSGRFAQHDPDRHILRRLQFQHYRILTHAIAKNEQHHSLRNACFIILRLRHSAGSPSPPAIPILAIFEIYGTPSTKIMHTVVLVGVVLPCHSCT